MTTADADSNGFVTGRSTDRLQFTHPWMIYQQHIILAPGVRPAHAPVDDLSPQSWFKLAGLLMP
jgi:hypothetical protein